MIWLWIGLFWLAHLGDLVSTWVGLARGCRELNPFYALFGFWGLVACKVVFNLMISWLVWFTYYRRVRRHALWAIFGAMAIGFGALVWNLHMIPRC